MLPVRGAGLVVGVQSYRLSSRRRSERWCPKAEKPPLMQRGCSRSTQPLCRGFWRGLTPNSAQRFTPDNLQSAKHCFDTVTRGVIFPDFLSSRSTARHSVKKHKTPVLTANEARLLLDSIDRRRSCRRAGGRHGGRRKSRPPVRGVLHGEHPEPEHAARVPSRVRGFFPLVRISRPPTRADRSGARCGLYREARQGTLAAER